MHSCLNFRMMCWGKKGFTCNSFLSACKSINTLIINREDSIFSGWVMSFRLCLSNVLTLSLQVWYFYSIPVRFSCKKTLVFFQKITNLTQVLFESFVIHFINKSKNLVTGITTFTHRFNPWINSIFLSGIECVWPLTSL